MTTILFYIKFLLALYVVLKLVKITLSNRRERNALLLFVVSFILILDARNIIRNSIPQEMMYQFAIVLFLGYFSIRLSGGSSKISSFMHNFVDLKSLFESEVVENLEEGIALIRTDTLEILTSNAPYQSFIGVGNSFLTVQDLVSALLRGENKFEITDFQNSKRTIEARLNNYGKRYALIYLKDITKLEESKSDSETVINELFYNWEKTAGLVMLRNFSGDVIFINKAMADFFSKVPLGLTGKNFSSLYEVESEYFHHLDIHNSLVLNENPFYKGTLKITLPHNYKGFMDLEEQIFTYNGEKHILTSAVDLTPKYYSELLLSSYQLIHPKLVNSQHFVYVVLDFIHDDILFKEQLNKSLLPQITDLQLFIKGLDLDNQSYLSDLTEFENIFQSKVITYHQKHQFLVEHGLYSSGGHFIGLILKYLSQEATLYNLPVMGAMIMSHIKEGVLLVNADGKIEYANEMIQRILNYNGDELLSKSILDVSMGLSYEIFQRNMEMTKHHKSLHFERTYLTKDLIQVPTEVIAMNLENERSDMLLLLVRDISEKFIYKKRLIDSQSRYAQIFDSLQDSVLEIQLPEKTVNFYREFDLEKGLIGLELSFLQWLNNIHDQDRSIVYEAVDIITSECSTNYVFEYRYFKIDQWQWYRATGKYVDSEIGASVVIINTNISEIKAITQKLEESRMILTESERIAHMAHWKFLVSKNMFFVSKTFGSIFKYKNSVEEIYYENLLEKIYPVDHEFFKSKFEKFIWNSEKLDLIIRVHSHGKISFINMIGQMYYDDEKMPVYAIGSVADVTDKMLVKQRFEESRMLLEHVVEHTEVGIIVIRSNGTIEKINNRALKLFKIEANSLLNSENLKMHIFSNGKISDKASVETFLNLTNHEPIEDVMISQGPYNLKVTTNHMNDPDQRYLGRIINITEL